MKRKLLPFCAMLLVPLFLGTSPAYAQDPFTKLGRGVANLLTGWVEIPKNVYTTSTEQNAFVGITGGLFKGIGAGVIRTGAGAVEIITFPFPTAPDYGPILQPEYVF